MQNLFWKIQIFSGDNTIAFNELHRHLIKGFNEYHDIWIVQNSNSPSLFSKALQHFKSYSQIAQCTHSVLLIKYTIYEFSIGLNHPVSLLNRVTGDFHRSACGINYSVYSNGRASRTTALGADTDTKMQENPNVCDKSGVISSHFQQGLFLWAKNFLMTLASGSLSLEKNMFVFNSSNF